MITSTDLALALDPVVMARACGIDPDPWQELMLRSQALRLIANCSRQSGKSTIAAILAMHTALYVEESLILLLSPTLRQSSELFKKCLGVYRALDRPVPASGETALTLSLTNDSRIISLPGSEETVRGYSKPALIILDEAARIPSELYASVRPMLAVSHGGRLLMLSTPFGRQGVFWDTWSSRSGEAWERYQIDATQCPRITQAFLAQERLALGDWWFSQEYMVEFNASAGALFKPEDIDAAFAEEVEPWTF